MDTKEELELIEAILKTLGNNVLRIILYGSVARGEETGESDVDIAIILSQKLSPELDDQLSDTIVDMNLKYDKVYSVVDIQKDDYEKWRSYIPFYRNVEKEGKVLWKAA